MDYEKIFSDTWDVFKENFMTYIIATLVAMIGSILIVTIAPLFYGLVDMAVRGVKGEPINYKDVFSGFDHFVRSWGFAIVAAVLLLVGYMLLIIPGIILSILLLYAFPLLVIRGYSGVDAIKESIEIGKNNFLDTAIISIILWIISAIGSYVVIGSLITTPIVVIASVVVTYRMIENNDTSYTYVADFEEIDDTSSDTNEGVQRSL
jgi:membrane-anchored glycerophosphoryl diester phosphodiesterase (GDPDase)